MTIQMKRYVLCIWFSLLAATMVNAADAVEAIELQVDKKIIHPELLGYNDNTSLEDILRVLPELLNRFTGNVIPNYSVQLDGKDVGSAQDAVLLQTKLMEIDCIEVTTSPTASEQTKGQGGTINVKLKALEEGVHGIAHLGLNTNMVEPTFYLGYKKNKLELRTTAIIDYCFPRDHVLNESLRKRESTDPHRTLFLEIDTIRQHAFSETAKMELKYQFTERDKITVWLMQTGDFGRKLTHSAAESHTAIQGDSVFFFRFGNSVDRANQWHVNLNTIAEYVHTIRNGGEVVWEVGYNYMPYRTLKNSTYNGDYYQLLNNIYDYDYRKGHEAYTHLKSKLRIPIEDQCHQLYLTIGANASYNYINHTTQDSVLFFSDDPLRETLYRGANIYASPYMEWKYDWKKLSLKAGVRYQFYRRYIRFEPNLMPGADSRQVSDDHDVTCNLNLSYQFNDRHRLRTMFARNLVRPNALEAYNGTIIDWSDLSVYEYGSAGNSHTYNAELDYLFSWSRGDHDLILDAGLRFVHSRDLIVKTVTIDEQMPALKILSVSNGGQSNVGTIDLSLCYRYRGFSFAFAHNQYFARNYFYYNLSITPMVDLPKEWYLSGRFTYHSRIEQEKSYLGDCFYAQLRVHKNIGHWIIYMEMDDIFGYRTTDKTYYSDTEYKLRTYSIYNRALAAGFSYKF